jgi:electron transfer flavoprotein beta subunit
MHIVVCIKQVPDSAQIRVHPVSNTIMRQGVPAIVNPYDLYALEEALRLKDRLCAKRSRSAPMKPFC